MKKIQNMYNCLFYTNNDNLNKTCMNNKRCRIYYDLDCEYYFEVDEGYKNVQSAQENER